MDDFLTKQVCDRCPNSLSMRTMSWFTTEAICMDCSGKEDILKKILRSKGKNDMEGCGHVPTLEEVNS